MCYYQAQSIAYILATHCGDSQRSQLKIAAIFVGSIGNLVCGWV